MENNTAPSERHTPFAILTREENDRNDGSLVLARFGPYVVVDQSKYDNVQTDDWHRERAEEYLRNLEAAPDLLDALKQLLFASENADETGYVTDAGFWIWRVFRKTPVPRSRRLKEKPPTLKTMDNTVRDGGPAFPHEERAAFNERAGMSLRAYFAAKAMQGLIAQKFGDCSPCDELCNVVGVTAVQFADSLLRALSDAPEATYPERKEAK